MQQRSVDSSFSTTLLLIRLLLTKKCVVPMPPHVSLSVCLSVSLSFSLPVCLLSVPVSPILSWQRILSLCWRVQQLDYGCLFHSFTVCLWLSVSFSLSLSLSLSVLFSLPYSLSLSSVSSCLRPSVVSVFICLVVWSLLLVYWAFLNVWVNESVISFIHSFIHSFSQSVSQSVSQYNMKACVMAGKLEGSKSVRLSGRQAVNQSVSQSVNQLVS